MELIYENVDYIEIKLPQSQYADFFNGIVLNSEYRRLGAFRFHLSKQHEHGMYNNYEIFFTDEQGEEVKIGIVNWIKLGTMAKRGIFLIIYGKPFARFGYYIFEYLLNELHYDFINYPLEVFRLDYCRDYQDNTVENFFQSIDKTLFTKIIPNRFCPIREEHTWFKLDFSEDLVRVYDKILDIVDKQIQKDVPMYKDYIKKNAVTRIEIQLSRRKFKGKIIRNLNELKEYARNALIKKQKKYFDIEKFNELSKNVVFERKINLLEESYKKEFEHSRKLFTAYYNKLLANPYGNKRLKREMLELEEKLYPISRIEGDYVD